jgi:beta-lactamase class D
MKILVLLACTIAASAQTWTEAQVARALAPFDHVLLLDHGDSVTRWTRHLEATKAFQPCSTFKLPHALVALETGVISLARNRKRCDSLECHSDHGEVDLDGAIRESCLSYFRQTARAIGPARMAAGLANLRYPATGNLEPLDGFWLTGDFRISAEQQLGWIRRFYTEALPVQADHLQAVRAATRRAGSGGWLIQGKTGSSREGFGWFTGQLTRQGQVSWVVILLRGKGASGLEAERRLRLLLVGSA